MRRRLRFGMVVLISQILLIALAVSWLVHAFIIVVHRSIYFVENNPFILWVEITATILIILFAASVLIIQLRRLGERRRGDDKGEGSRGE